MHPSGAIIVFRKPTFGTDLVSMSALVIYQQLRISGAQVQAASQPSMIIMRENKIPQETLRSGFMVFFQLPVISTAFFLVLYSGGLWRW